MLNQHRVTCLLMLNFILFRQLAEPQPDPGSQGVWGGDYGAAPHQPHCRATYGLWGKGGAPSYNPVTLTSAACHHQRRNRRANSQPARAPFYCLASLSGEAGALEVHHATYIKCLCRHTKPGSSTMQVRLRRTLSAPSAIQLLHMTALGQKPIHR